MRYGRSGSAGIVKLALGSVLAAFLMASLPAAPAWGQKPALPKKVKTRNIDEFLSHAGHAALFGRQVVTGGQVGPAAGPGTTSLTGDAFVNDPCLDPSPTKPFPFNFFDVVQSETEIAVLNPLGGPPGKKMVVGYNDSRGFTTNSEGLSGYSFTVNGGKSWIDAGGLPPLFPFEGPPPPEGLNNDQYFGDPVVAVHHATQTFYYSSIYLSSNGYFTISVNKGSFQTAPPQGIESVANTRCFNRPALHEVPRPPNRVPERIVWDPPVEAVTPPFLGVDNGDFLDKEWLHVDQATGKLYVTYTRFTPLGETPLEMVVSADQGQTWSIPLTIVPNLLDTFNQATMPTTTETGRVIVTWFSRTFDLITGAELSQRIEAAFSDNDGLTWSLVNTVADVNPQGEPLGYNRARPTILNAPSIHADLAADDGIFTPDELARPGFGNVYLTYFDGATTLPNTTFDKTANIHLSTSTDGGATWGPEVLVNDDGTATTHLFPTVKAARDGIVYVGWLDRRMDTTNNILTDEFAASSSDFGASFGANQRQTSVSSSWFTRADAAPNQGDYNSSELINHHQFVIVWSDGRFYPPGNATFLAIDNVSTPDVIFNKAKGFVLGPPIP